MPHQEKRAWIMLIVSTITYAAYLIIILGRAGGRPLASVPYAATLLWLVGLSIAASILAEIAVSVANPRAAREKDVRDRQIGRLGEYCRQSFVIIGAVAAMIMAMARWDWFWIANVIYLGFTLSAVLGSMTKITAYHKGLPRW
jgi:cell division protein FtsW (lipid II flippase)